MKDKSRSKVTTDSSVQLLSRKVATKGMKEDGCQKKTVSKCIFKSLGEVMPSETTGVTENEGEKRGKRAKKFGCRSQKRPYQGVVGHKMEGKKSH